MNRTDRVVALIPARGGSKSIPLKNSKMIAGKPLLHWVLRAVLECAFVDDVYVSTDSSLIGKCATDICNEKVHVISRSAASATDEASTEYALLEFAEKVDFSYIVLIQATSPLLTTIELEEAWNKYKSAGYDSLLSVVRQKRFLWTANDDGVAAAINYDPKLRPRRQDFEGFLVENGAFYITSRERLLASKCRLSGTIGVFEMPEETYWELDEPKDWTIIENYLMRNKIQVKRDKLKSIKVLAMDVDGVLTNAGMYYSEFGDELKRFNTRDGKGIELIKRLGIKTAVVTSENTEIVTRRSAKLKIDCVYQGVTDKAAALAMLAAEIGEPVSAIAYIGDDVNDLAAIRIAGVSFCPSDATDMVKREVDFVLSTPGGDGAVREVCNLLIASLQEEG